MFKIGDTVAWTSSASGGTTSKSGTIVQVVPIGSRPGREWGLDAPGSPRDHISYVVAVKVGKTDKAKPRHYWPRVAALVPTKKEARHG